MWGSSTQKNIATVRRFMERPTGADADAVATLVDTLFAPEHVHHFPNGDSFGRDGVKQLVTSIDTTLPDRRTAIDDIIAASDKVVVRFTTEGTHLGEGLGVPPTGKRVRQTGIDIFRLRGGKIVERWGEVDRLGLLRQVGAIPEV
jgi:predicted ester cyclase